MKTDGKTAAYTIAPIPVAFQIMVKPVGAKCNLDCKYCYYLAKKQMYDAPVQPEMSEQTLERFIDEYIASQNVPVIQFVWHGGEPTLAGMDYFKRILRLQCQYSRGRHIENILQTNGTLLDDEWCSFFSNNNFLVGISIDGPQHIHDRYRLNRAGKSSFAQVMRGVELLIKHSVEFNTLSVVNDYNAHFPLEIYRFLKSIGSRYMQFTPVVERIAGDDITSLMAADERDGRLAEWSVQALDYGKFLCDVFDEWILNDVGAYYVPTFDSVLANWTGNPTAICVHAETCGHVGAIERNGDLFACDHFVFPQYRLGNIHANTLVSMMFSPRQIAFARAKRDALPPYCRDCEYLFACNGECPKNRIITAPDGSAGLNYLCNGLKLFYKHVAPFMDFMAEELANERPPANVMAWARTRHNNN